MVLIGILCFFWTGMAFAETFQVIHCLYVSADNNGVVTVKGHPDDINRIGLLCQFKPDKFKGRDWMDNRILSPVSKTDTEVRFQMNMSSAQKGQRAFNLKSGRYWLSIPSSLVVVGSNLILEMSQPSADSEDGRGGAHFVFTPPIR